MTALTSEAEDKLALEDEQTDYRARLGRWRREVISSILNPVWWLAMRVTSLARGPITHHFAVVRKSNEMNVFETMVHGKAEHLAYEMAVLATSDAKIWARAVVLAFHDCPGNVGVDLSDVLELGVSLNLHHFAAYWRRVVLDCKRLPNALFLLTLSPPTQYCSKRKALAKFVLESPPNLLDSNTRKLRGLCIDEFRVCAEEGTLGPILFSIITAWACSCECDVAINEGHNSLIKAISNRCKNIGLPLLSARANAKKELKVGVRGAPAKWSLVKHSALSMVEDQRVVFR